MKKSVEILGLPVISITEGRELGMSKTLLIDAKNGLVAAITIEDEDWYRGVKLIPYESVIAIGDDAVTVTHSENILKLDEAGDYETLLDENIRVIGTKAITKNGTIQGKITELFIGDDGKIEKCEITAPDGTTSEVTADQISIFGKQVTVIDPDAEKKTEFISSFNTEPAIESPAADYAPEPVADFVAENPAPEMPEMPTEEVAPEMPAVESIPVSESATDMLPENIEEVMTPEPEMPAEEVAPVMPEMPAEEVAPEVPEMPTEEVAPVMPEMPTEEVAPTPEPEPAKAAAMTQQAEALKAALQRAMANQSKPAPKKSAAAEKATEERHRRFLLGKKATRTITADTGAVIVEEGADITEEVLQKAKLANKFIDLSMNVR